MRGNKVLTLLLITIASIAFGIVTYAFAASNTISTRNVGEGAGVITRYSDIIPTYVLDQTNPQLIAGVNFNLSADAVSVKVKLNSTGTTWYTCTVTHSPPWPVSCTTTGATVQNADEFRVVAASD